MYRESIIKILGFFVVIGESIIRLAKLGQTDIFTGRTIPLVSQNAQDEDFFWKNTTDIEEDSSPIDNDTPMVLTHVDINPATGFEMVGACDTGGNPLGHNLVLEE